MFTIIQQYSETSLQQPSSGTGLLALVERLALSRSLPFNHSKIIVEVFFMKVISLKCSIIQLSVEKYSYKVLCRTGAACNDAIESIAEPMHVTDAVRCLLLSRKSGTSFSASF